MLDHPRQGLEGAQGVACDQVVAVGQRGDDALLDGLVPRLAAVRVDPDDAVREGAEASHLLLEKVDATALPAVAEDHDHGAAGHAALTPAVEERRLAITGWVYGAFVMTILMYGVRAEESDDIDFEIFDGPETALAPLLFDNDGVLSTGLEPDWRTMPVWGRPEATPEPESARTWALRNAVADRQTRRKIASDLAPNSRHGELPTPPHAPVSPAPVVAPVPVPAQDALSDNRPPGYGTPLPRRNSRV